jgi:hypothetical protein
MTPEGSIKALCYKPTGRNFSYPLSSRPKHQASPDSVLYILSSWRLRLALHNCCMLARLAEMQEPPPGRDLVQLRALACHLLHRCHSTLFPQLWRIHGMSRCEHVQIQSFLWRWVSHTLIIFSRKIGKLLGPVSRCIFKGAYQNINWTL